MVKRTQTICRVCLTILWGCRLKGYGETVNPVDKNMAKVNSNLFLVNIYSKSTKKIHDNLQVTCSNDFTVDFEHVFIHMVCTILSKIIPNILE